MAHIYMHFDFGADEEKAQQARHKLDVWKQAFRLDKKLQYKLDRPEDDEADADAEESAAEDSEKPKTKSKGHSTKDGQPDDDGGANVSLLVRLYFSSHEKLSEQRWIERIPSEEPFKDASPKILRQGEPGFDAAVKQFADLN